MIYKAFFLVSILGCCVRHALMEVIVRTTDIVCLIYLHQWYCSYF